MKDPRTRFIGVRCSDAEYVAITETANTARLSAGGFLRELAIGTAGPRAVRRPSLERTEFARLVGWLGKLGSNVNQIAKAVHTTGNLPSRTELALIREEVMRMREALMKALDRDH